MLPNSHRACTWYPRSWLPRPPDRTGEQTKIGRIDAAHAVPSGATGTPARYLGHPGAAEVCRYLGMYMARGKGQGTGMYVHTYLNLHWQPNQPLSQQPVHPHSEKYIPPTPYKQCLLKPARVPPSQRRGSHTFADPVKMGRTACTATWDDPGPRRLHVPAQAPSYICPYLPSHGVHEVRVPYPSAPCIASMSTLGGYKVQTDRGKQVDGHSNVSG